MAKIISKQKEKEGYASIKVTSNGLYTWIDAPDVGIINHPTYSLKSQKLESKLISKNDIYEYINDISFDYASALHAGNFKHTLKYPISLDPDDILLNFSIWVKKNEPGIIIDCVTGHYIRSIDAVKVITNVKKLTVGYTQCSTYLPKAYNSILGSFVALHEEDLLENGYTENLNTGIFYNEENTDHYEIGEYHKYKNLVSSLLKFCTKAEKIKYGAESNSYILTEGKQYTFGCELEYSTLWIPERFEIKYNMECVRDGSLNKDIPGNVGGPEIVTGVLKGDAGINHLQDICNELAPRGVVDKKCGVHVHVGGFNRSDDFVLFSYLLGLKVQKEIFDMMPPSRKENEYCKLLTNLGFTFDKKDTALEYKMKKNKYYDVLFAHLAVKQTVGKFCNSKSQHPLGAKCNWNHETPRYCWLNLIPTAFNTRENGVYTIEFRPMAGSSNFKKIYNWVKICMAFVYYVENNQRDIMFKENITLNDIITNAYPKTGSSLVKYIMDRKIKFNSFEGNNIENKEYNEKVNKKMSIKDLVCA